MKNYYKKGDNMFTLQTKHTIFGAHKLKDQGGKCTKLHGHQYTIVLTLKADELDYRNMIMDTYDIEKIFNDFIGVDHLYLNDFMDEENPTMEAMSVFFYEGLKDKLPNLTSVAVGETPECLCIYTPDE